MRTLRIQLHALAVEFYTHHNEDGRETCADVNDCWITLVLQETLHLHLPLGISGLRQVTRGDRFFSAVCLRSPFQTMFALLTKLRPLSVMWYRRMSAPKWSRAERSAKMWWPSSGCFSRRRSIPLAWSPVTSAIMALNGLSIGFLFPVVGPCSPSTTNLPSRRSKRRHRQWEPGCVNFDASTRGSEDRLRGHSVVLEAPRSRPPSSPLTLSSLSA